MAEKANDVIARFGGQSALARALGVNQSTVQHWSKTGQIPSWRQEQIQRAAQERGVMGFARAAAPGQPAAPMVHGRAETVQYADREIGALREEIGHLRAMVEQLVGAVEALKGASSEAKGRAMGGASRSGRKAAPKGQRASGSKSERS